MRKIGIQKAMSFKSRANIQKGRDSKRSTNKEKEAYAGTINIKEFSSTNAVILTGRLSNHVHQYSSRSNVFEQSLFLRRNAIEVYSFYLKAIVSQSMLKAKTKGCKKNAWKHLMCLRQFCSNATKLFHTQYNYTKSNKHFKC